MTTDEWRQLG